MIGFFEPPEWEEPARSVAQLDVSDYTASSGARVYMTFNTISAGQHAFGDGSDAVADRRELARDLLRKWRSTWYSRA
jgi:hypothetical protein